MDFAARYAIEQFWWNYVDAVDNRKWQQLEHAVGDAVVTVVHEGLELHGGGATVAAYQRLLVDFPPVDHLVLHPVFDDIASRRTRGRCRYVVLDRAAMRLWSSGTYETVIRELPPGDYVVESHVIERTAPSSPPA